jgi:hypothetical protein
VAGAVSTDGHYRGHYLHICVRQGEFVITVDLTRTLIDNFHDNKKTSTGHEDTASFNEWLMGVCVLTLALVLMGLLGAAQEMVYTTFGREWREGLFYTVCIC